jgi:PIN domain nuclease of toxin-antitoxin system
LIVLDTQMWIWFHQGHSRLPSVVAGEIRRLRHAVVISSISTWEVALAIEKGMIISNASPIATVKAWLETVPMTVTPVDTEIALLSRTLPFEHEDPADRFIAATAHRLGAPLATSDQRLIDLPWLKTLS